MHQKHHIIVFGPELIQLTTGSNAWDDVKELVDMLCNMLDVLTCKVLIVNILTNRKGKGLWVRGIRPVVNISKGGRG